MKILILLVLLASCSSSNKSNQDLNKINNSDFSKKKTTKQTEFRDFILTSQKSGTVFLSDESIDFLNQAQLEQFANDNKDILDLSLLCSRSEMKQFDSLVDVLYTSYSKLPSFWNTIGNCHLKKGNLKRALMFYNKALELDANYFPSMNNLGVFYLKHFNYQKALLAFEKANELSKFSKTPKYNLILVYLKFGLLGKAKNLLSPLLSQFPQEKRLIKLSAYLSYAEADYTSSVQNFSALIGSKLLSEKDKLYLTYAYFKTGSKDKGAGVLKSIKLNELDSSSKAFFNYLTSKAGESL